MDLNSVVSQIAAQRCAPCPIAPPCAIADVVEASLLVACAFVAGVTLGAIVGRGFRAPAPVIHISRPEPAIQLGPSLRWDEAAPGSPLSRTAGSDCSSRRSASTGTIGNPLILDSLAAAETRRS